MQVESLGMRCVGSNALISCGLSCSVVSVVLVVVRVPSVVV
jgi:hypothetical protein